MNPNVNKVALHERIAGTFFGKEVAKQNIESTAKKTLLSLFLLFGAPSASNELLQKLSSDSFSKQNKLDRERQGERNTTRYHNKVVTIVCS